MKVNQVLKQSIKETNKLLNGNPPLVENESKIDSAVTLIVCIGLGIIILTAALIVR